MRSSGEGHRCKVAYAGDFSCPGPENRSESAQKDVHMLHMHIIPIIMDSAKRN